MEAELWECVTWGPGARRSQDWGALVRGEGWVKGGKQEQPLEAFNG